VLCLVPSKHHDPSDEAAPWPRVRRPTGSFLRELASMLYRHHNPHRPCLSFLSTLVLSTDGVCLSRHCFVWACSQ
jgi:hypothetical protein